MAADTCLRLKQNSDFTCAHCNCQYKSRDVFIKHLNYVLSSCGQEGDMKHQCSPCSIPFSTISELIDHLEVSDIHKLSFHNCACQGMASKLRSCLTNPDVLHQRCVSHFSEASLEHMGYSPLHCTIMNGFLSCTIKLLKWGANPNLQDEQGYTPLHVAMVKGDISFIMALLRHGGNLFQVDSKNRTPFDIAEYCTKYTVLMKLFCFEEEDGRYVPTHVRNHDIAYRVVEHYNEYCSKQSNDDASKESEESIATANGLAASHTGSPGNEDASDKNSCSAVVDPSYMRTLNRNYLAQVFDQLLNLEVTRGIYYDVINHCKERVKHFKLLVLGHVAAGKTSLVRTLSGKEFCGEREPTDGIDSSFLEAVSINDSWKEICDKELTYNTVVAKKFIDNLNLEEVVRTLTNEICSSLPNQFRSRLSLTDSSSSDNATTVLPAKKEDQSIDEPIKGRIRELMSCPSNLPDDKFKVTILDFAGHTLYLPMHHIFLNAKALYLVCFDLQAHKKDPEGNMKELQFWLNSVVAHKGDEPAIFLVGTHADSVEESDIEKANRDIMEKLYYRFMNCFIFKGDKIFFPIDNSKGPEDCRAKFLKMKIQSEAQELSCGSDDEVPIKWLRCEKYIHETVTKDKDIFSIKKEELRKRFESFCKEFDDEDYQKMLEMFHDNGIIWLPELLVTKAESMGRFSDVVILNIQHLMDSMTNVFKLALEDSSKAPRLQRRAAKLLQESAKISHANLEKALIHQSTSTREVIDLLVIYHIIVPAERINSNDATDTMSPRQTSTPKKADTRLYIIPALLPEESLNDTWCKYRDPLTEHTFYIDFYGFACEAVFHQVLVRLAEYSTRTDNFNPFIRKFDCVLGWYNVICYRLEYNKHVCVIKGTVSKLPNDTGGCGRELMMFLNNVLNETCENFFRFQKFKFLIPCTSPTCEQGCADPFSAQFASESHGTHLLDYNPLEPGAKYCGRNNINLSSWACYAEHRTHSLNSDSTDASSLEYTQSVSVDSGVSEPNSASLNRVEEGMLTIVSEDIGNTWPRLARHLDWPKDTSVANRVDRLSSESRYTDDKERAFQILIEWLRCMGDSANLDMLVKGLTKCERTDIAEKLSRFRF